MLGFAMLKLLVESALESSIEELDLRGVACPMNFVKTRLKLDKMQSGSLLLLFVDGGEPFESVMSSLESEGHLVDACEHHSQGYHSIKIRKG